MKIISTVSPWIDSMELNFQIEFRTLSLSIGFINSKSDSFKLRLISKLPVIYTHRPNFMRTTAKLGVKNPFETDLNSLDAFFIISMETYT